MKYQLINANYKITENVYYYAKMFTLELEIEAESIKYS